MDPGVTIFSQPNFTGSRQFFNSFGTHKLKKLGATQEQMVGKWFYIVHAVKVNGKEYAVDKRTGNVPGNNYHLYEWSKDNVNQIFTMMPNGVIKSYDNQLAMDVRNGVFQNGTIIQNCAINNSDAQLWTYDPEKQKLKLKNKDFCLNLNNNEHKNTAVINITATADTDSQKWEVRLCEITEGFIDKNGRWVKEQYVDMSIGKFSSYIGKPFYLRSRGNSKFVIDTEGHQYGGGFIKIYQKVEDMHVNQTWTVDKDGHLISWQNRNSILYLPSTGNGVQPTIIGWAGNESKANGTLTKWRLNNDGQIESINVPSKVLDINGGNYNNNSRVILWPKHGGANQKWDLIEINIKTSFPASNRTTLVNQRFYIVHDTKGSGNKNYALDNTGRIGNGIRFYMWEFVRGNTNQLFTMTERGAIKCVNGNEVLDVNGGNLNNGSTIVQWPPHGGPNQTWGYDWNKKNIYVYSKPAMQLHAGANEYKNSGQTCLWSCGDCSGSKWWIVFEDGTCFNRDFKPMTEVKNDIGQFTNWVGKTIHIKSINCQNIIVDSRVAQNGTGGHKGGSKIGTYEYNPDYKGTQNWTIDTFGRIVLTDQNKQWCIYASSLNNSTPLTLVKIDKLDKFDMKQYWRLNTDGTIVNIADPNKAFDMDSRTTCKSDGEIHIYNLHRGANQKWVVADAPVDIGKFKDWIGKPFYIQSQGNAKFVIDTEGHQNGGGFIKIYENQNNQHVNQTWTVDKDGHLISWQNRNSILYIEATTNGVQPIIIGWKGNESKANSPNAKWTLTNTGQIESAAIPSRCLDISGAKYANNTRVILWDKHTGANQKWNTPEANKPKVFKLVPINDIGSIIVEQLTDVIIYGASADSKLKPKKVTLHNGMRFRPGKDPNTIAYKIDDFVKKYGITTVKEIEIKDASIDNKQTDKVEEYEGFAPFTDENGEWKTSGIVLLTLIIGIIICGVGFGICQYILTKKNKDDKDNTLTNKSDKSELTNNLDF